MGHLPKHLEAAPCLEARRIAAALGPGGAECRWSDQDNQTLGWAMVQLVAPHLLLLDHRLWLGGEEYEGSALIKVAQARHFNSRHPFDLLICPGCARRLSDEREPYPDPSPAHRKLFFADGEWRCGRCTSLPYRSQAIGSGAALWERRRALERLVAKGRPKGMWSRTFAELTEEFDELIKRTGDKPISAGGEYSVKVSAEWSAIKSIHRSEDV